MRRVTESATHPYEWMAPDDVVRFVRRQYLESIEWVNHVERDSRYAPRFVTGAMLVRIGQGIWTRSTAPLFVGILRSDHRLEVRRFSEDGERCLILDHQTQRRMATYHTRTGQRAATQDLGDATLVYSMVYDSSDGRWKIDAFVQELPTGWERRRSAKLIVDVDQLAPHGGRDS